MTLQPIASGIRGVSADRRAPRLAKIRLGVQAPNKAGNGTHPEMSPHFVFDDDAVGHELVRMFGIECTEIPVAFPSDDPSEFARRNLEMWGAGTLKCRGDGSAAQALVNLQEFAKYQANDDRTSPPLALWSSTARAGAEQRQGAAVPERRMITCLGLGYDGVAACPQLEANNCKATMHLQFIVRGFPGLGVFQVDTGSVVNIQRLDDFLAYLGAYTDQRFAMVPLLMRLEPYEMRGRRYYGLTFAVDFAAMQAAGVGALPAVAELSVTQRLVRYLPEESQRPAELLAGAREVDDEAPDDALEGEVLEEPGDDDTAAEDEDEAESAEVVGMVQDGGPLSRVVWERVGALLTQVCEQRFGGDWEALYRGIGSWPPAEPFLQRTAGARRAYIDPRGRTDDEAMRLEAAILQWEAASKEAAAATSVVRVERTTGPRPPRARQPKDERLGGFANVGEFYQRATKELGLNGDRVREIAGVAGNVAPNLIVTYEGEAGAGLDALWLACATAAAGVEVP